MRQRWLQHSGEELSVKRISSGTPKGEQAHLYIMAPYLAKVGCRQNEESNLSGNETREPSVEWPRFQHCAVESNIILPPSAAAPNSVSG